MTWIGMVALAVFVVWFSARFVRAAKKGPWPWYGWMGALIMAVSEVLLWRKNHFVGLYFTPLAWTGYILFADAVVVRLSAHSWLRDSRKRFLWLALWSIPLWLVFEAYNLHLKNWMYLNLPEDIVLRYLGYGWSFATIWPALFETTDLVTALNIFSVRRKESEVQPSATLLALSLLCGVLLLVVPLIVSQPAAGYLFGLVWLGMIFAIDPINFWLGKRSLLKNWVNQDRRDVYAMLLAGLFCGFLWEFWNYWAVARWIYVFPIMQNFKIFEMPLPGYLGFPVFCVECYVMFELVILPQTKAQDPPSVSSSEESGGDHSRPGIFESIPSTRNLAADSAESVKR